MIDKFKRGVKFCCFLNFIVIKYVKIIAKIVELVISLIINKINKY